MPVYSWFHSVYIPNYQIGLYNNDNSVDIYNEQYASSMHMVIYNYRDVTCDIYLRRNSAVVLDTIII